MRLAVINRQRDSDLPILRFNKKKRLSKEYQAYNIGSKHGLTPKVLYRFEGGLICEYLDGEIVFSILQKDKSKVWDILTEATKTYKKLHDLGITHLDATLKNFIMDNTQMKVIDFEYYPAKKLSLELRKAYHYIRIIEHTLRIIPIKEQKNYHDFLNVLDGTVPKDIRNVNLH